MTILAVTGMTKEAGIIGTAGVVVVVGGGDGDGLATKLDALHGDIGGVISIGLGGALSPLLKVGDVVIGEKIITAPKTGTVMPAGATGWRHVWRRPIRAASSAATSSSMKRRPRLGFTPALARWWSTWNPRSPPASLQGETCRWRHCA